MFNNYFSRNAQILCVSVFLFSISFNAVSQPYWQGFGLRVDRPIYGLFHDTIDNKLYICGEFRYANNVHVQGVLSWNGTDFSPMGLGFDFYYGTPSIKKMIRYKDEIYAGGDARSVDTIPINSIARWNGAKWDSVSSGVRDNDPDIPPGRIFDMIIHNDELFVAGYFMHAGSVNANCVARWNGVSWNSAYGFPNYLEDTIHSNYTVYSIASYNGNLYAGGYIQDSLQNPVSIVYHDGNKWKTLGGGIKGGQSGVFCMQAYKNELYVGGCFCKQDGNVGNGIQKWNGSQWSEVGEGVTLSGSYFSAVKHMFVMNDELYVTGDFDRVGTVPASCIAKWNGSQWCVIDSSGIPAPFADLSDYDNKLVCAGFLMLHNDTNLQVLVSWTGGNHVDTCSIIYNTVIGIIDKNMSVNLFPNPATDFATIQYSLEKPGQISITLTDILSSEKTLLVEQYQISGNHSIQFNTMALKPGIYLCTLKTNSFTISAKLVIIR